VAEGEGEQGNQGHHLLHGGVFSQLRAGLRTKVI
jgi:hypothetical protein